MTKEGSGELILTGTNTYSGGTTLNNGIISVGSDNNLGATSGGLTFDGGDLRFDASFDLDANRSILLNAGGGTIRTNIYDTTISQTITGTGGLTKIGAGTLTLTGNSDTTGYTVNQGTLQIGDGGMTGEISGGVNINDAGANLVFNRSNNLSYNGVISGIGELVKEGTGTLTLSGANTHGGGTTVNGGTLTLGHLNALGDGGLTINASGTVDLDANTYRVNDDIDIVGGVLNLAGTTLNASGLTGEIGNSVTLSGSALLDVTSAGLINLNGGGAGGGDGTQGGSFTMTGGIFNLGSAATLQALGSTGGIPTTGFGGSVSLTGGVSTLDGTVAVHGSTQGAGGFGPGGDGGNVTVDGTAVVTLTGPVNLTGGDASPLMAMPFPFDGGAGGDLDIIGGAFTMDAATATVDLRGGAGVDGGGPGADGAVNVSGGTLTLNAGLIKGSNATPSADPINLVGADINVTGGDVVATAAMTIKNGAAVNLSAGSVTATTLREVGTGNFNFTGGTLTVDTFEGVLVQDGGTLLIGGSPGETDVTQNYTINAGTLEIELFGNGGGSPVAGVDFDQLTADTANLGGTLDLVIDAGYTPTLGDLFPIIGTSSGVSGTFGAVSGADIGSGLMLGVLYGANDVTVGVFLAGDFDFDNVVDGFDFLEWQRDPTIGSLADWQTNYGMTAPLVAASAAVPEPSTGIVLLIGMMAMLFRRDVVVL